MNSTNCWDAAFALYRGQLQYYAALLLPCACSSEIVMQVEDSVKSVAVPDDDKLNYLLRTLAQNVIRHLRECTQPPEECEASASAQSSTAIESLMPQERLVYFLREMLEYPTRDAALLMGMSDAQIEQLLSFARRRIAEANDTTTVQARYTHWQYFRWSFSGLGRQ